MKQGGKGKFYTFMVIPHDSTGKPISFRLHSVLVKFVLLLAIVSISAFSFSLLYSAFLSGKLIHYGITLQNETENSKKLNEVAGETDNIKRELQAVLDQNNELRRVLGLKINKTRVEISAKSSKKNPPYGLNFKLNNLTSSLKLSIREVKETKNSLAELKAVVKKLQVELAYAPTGWPIKGTIVSGYGYRSYPWRGMHSGVDIKAGFGDPVRAAAGGVVVASGWNRGYGKAIDIDHGNGYMTRYGHNAVLASHVGDRVKKGQIISYVGMTGWTTGPHLHYEIRKNDVAMNPIVYLNLNLLSASRLSAN